MSDQAEAIKPFLDVKGAVKVAKAYLTDLLAEEGITNLGLEEIEHDGEQGIWLVTLGFSRNWDATNTLIGLTRDAAHRVYRTLKVSDADGKILSVRRNEIPD
jgi:hypothetical protein